MLGHSYRLVTAFGIPIRIHISLILLLAVMGTWILLSSGFAGLLLMVALVVCAFAGISLHELGHSLVAIRLGCGVHEITLTFIGGVAQMNRIPTRPREEILMASAGPAVSLALGAMFLAAGEWLPEATARSWWLLRVLNLSVQFDVRSNLLQCVGFMNIALGLFNLLPAFPMDGGRILRAALSVPMGRLRATRLAVQLGRAAAVLMVAGGLYSGIWTVAVAAVFIYVAAGREYEAVRREYRPPPLTFFFWPPAPPRRDRPDASGEVVIGPPPYEGGPGSRTRVTPDRGGNR